MKHLSCLFVVVLVAVIFVADNSLVVAESMQKSAATSAPAKVIGVYVFPNVRLKDLDNDITNDRGITLGGIGSDLWHGPADQPNRFWMLSDRGPNGQLRIQGKKRRTFPVPEFTPVILHVELDQKKVRILQTIPIVGPDEKPVTGLSNEEHGKETPYGYQGRKRVPCNPSGLDTEGLVRTENGHFWLSEEYSPSLVHCDKHGKVLMRFVPIGTKLDGASYPIDACLPGILLQRKDNRGLEGLTITRDEKTLYAIMQSALYHPSKKQGKRSRNARLLAFDTVHKKPSAEYVYRVEDHRGFARDAKEPSDIKLSGLAMLDDTTMLVLERTDESARLYKADLTRATNILNTRWDLPATLPALETIDNLPAVGVTPLSKTLVLDLSQLPNMPQKIEGVAIIDAHTIAVANDNDFDLGRYDSEGNNHGNGVKSVICVIRLTTPLF